MYCESCGKIKEVDAEQCLNCGHEGINRLATSPKPPEEPTSFRVAHDKSEESTPPSSPADMLDMFRGLPSRKRILIAASIFWTISVLLYVLLFCGTYQCKKFGGVIVFPITTSWLALWLYDNIISRNNTGDRYPDSEVAENPQPHIKEVSFGFSSNVIDEFFDLETKNGDIGLGHLIIGSTIIMAATMYIGFQNAGSCFSYSYSIDCMQQWAGELIGYNSVGLAISATAFLFGVVALKAKPTRKLFLSSLLLVSVIECILMAVGRYASKL